MWNKVKNINWRKILYSVLGLGAFCALLTLMSFIAVKSKEQACTEIKVVILGESSFIDQQDIHQFIVEKYGELKSRTLTSIPTHDIEKDLTAIPHIHSSTVNTEMDGRLVVRVQQRNAVMRIINNEGNDFYVDEDGLKLPVSLKFVPRVMVVNGHIAEKYQSGMDSVQTQLVRDLFKVVSFINASESWQNQVLQLYVNRQGEIEIVPRVGDQQIILGSADELEAKFNKLELFYTRVVPRTGFDAYKSVNLKYAGQLVCERNAGFDLQELIHQKDSVNQVKNNSNNTQ